MKLSDDFVRYLQNGEPRCGELPDFPSWFEPWPEENLEQFNKKYQVEEHAPGFFGFGTNGGGECSLLDPTEEYTHCRLSAWSQKFRSDWLLHGLNLKRRL
jgi:hypothetical protein